MLFVLSHSPDTHPLALESLDAVMTAALLGQAVTVVFAGDGRALLSDSDAADKLALLATLDIEHFYCLSEQNDEQAPNSLLPLEPLTGTELGQLFNQHAEVLSF